MDFNELPIVKKVHEELDDARFSMERHGINPTYTKGCRGPLCRKAHREYQQEDGSAPSSSLRDLDPYIEHMTHDHWVDYEIAEIKAGRHPKIMALEVVIPPDREEPASA